MAMEEIKVRDQWAGTWEWRRKGYDDTGGSQGKCGNGMMTVCGSGMCRRKKERKKEKAMLGWDGQAWMREALSEGGEEP